MATADFTIADVLAWARTKPADERYCYFDHGRCALAQFLIDTGISRDPIVYGDEWEDDRRNTRPIADPLADALATASTFGAFVKLLEKLCPETPAKPISDTWVKADAYMPDGLDELIEEFALLPVQA